MRCKRQRQLVRARHHLRLQLHHLLRHAPLEAGVERGQLLGLARDGELVLVVALARGVGQPRQRHADEVGAHHVRQVGEARVVRVLKGEERGDHGDRAGEVGADGLRRRERGDDRDAEAVADVRRHRGDDDLIEAAAQGAVHEVGGGEERPDDADEARPPPPEDGRGEERHRDHHGVRGDDAGPPAQDVGREGRARRRRDVEERDVRDVQDGHERRQHAHAAAVQLGEGSRQISRLHAEIVSRRGFR